MIATYRKRVGFQAQRNANLVGREGEPFEIIGVVQNSHHTPGYQNIPMLRVRFERDGTVSDVWPDEVLEKE